MAGVPIPSVRVDFRSQCVGSFFLYYFIKTTGPLCSPGLARCRVGAVDLLRWQLVLLRSCSCMCIGCCLRNRFVLKLTENPVVCLVPTPNPPQSTLVGSTSEQCKTGRGPGKTSIPHTCSVFLFVLFFFLFFCFFCLFEGTIGRISFLCGDFHSSPRKKKITPLLAPESPSCSRHRDDVEVVLSVFSPPVPVDVARAPPHFDPPGRSRV